MNRAWRSVKFTVGWTITAADETGIVQLSADAWTDSLNQDGTEPATLRYRLLLLHLPAKLATHARRRVLSIPETWPWAVHSDT